MKVTIYGAGYVGLVTGACLAELGHHVLCIDINKQKIQELNDGQVLIYEPGLTDLIKKNINHGTLQFSADTARGAAHGLFQFIAVNTPPNADGSADISHVLDVADNIATEANEFKIIINKSTVPVGTAERVKQRILTTARKYYKSFSFSVASNPEFLREGSAIDDFMHADRIIIGADNQKTENYLRELYQPLVTRSIPLLVMSIRSAELCKYVANAMLASRISFMNEMANIAETVGADITEVEQGIALDPRIGKQFLSAGCGYGGSCFPKDVTALQQIALENSVEPLMLNAVNLVNQQQRHVLFKKLQQHFNNNLKGKTIALWGLAFKPNTNDLREASSGYLLQDLWKAGASVQVYDPVAMSDAKILYGERDDLIFCDDKQACLDNADALVVITEWQEFKDADVVAMLSTQNKIAVFDGRNIYSVAEFKKAGIDYYRIGLSIPLFK